MHIYTAFITNYTFVKVYFELAYGYMEFCFLSSYNKKGTCYSVLLDFHMTMINVAVLYVVQLEVRLKVHFNKLLLPNFYLYTLLWIIHTDEKNIYPTSYITSYFYVIVNLMYKWLDELVV